MLANLPAASGVQILVCVLLTALVGFATWLKIRKASHDGSSRDVFLAGGGLSWLFVAGSITLTNLSTDQLVGMNGNQMLLLAWWEICGFAGLLILAYIFVPIYYRNNCTTVTELLEKRYGGRSIRTLISALFLFGNILIYLPAALYSGGLFMQSLFGSTMPILFFAGILAVISAAYTIFGGLRGGRGDGHLFRHWRARAGGADRHPCAGSGRFRHCHRCADRAADHDRRAGFSDPLPYPVYRHDLHPDILLVNEPEYHPARHGGADRERSPEGRDGGRHSAHPHRPAHRRDTGQSSRTRCSAMSVMPLMARLIAEILPPWLSGAFAAMVAAAVITTFSAVLNSSVALYSIDFHEQFVGRGEGSLEARGG